METDQLFLSQAVTAAWIAAISASLAFLVSLGVFSQQISDRRRKQASQVSAWVTKMDSSPTATTSVVHFTIANHSDEPVWKCQADIAHGKGDLWILHVATDQGVIPPRSSRGELTVNVKTSHPEWRASTIEPGDYPMVLLHFVDASGRQWRRTMDGALLDLGRPQKRGSPWKRLRSWRHRRRH